MGIGHRVLPGLLIAQKPRAMVTTNQHPERKHVSLVVLVLDNLAVVSVTQQRNPPLLECAIQPIVHINTQVQQSYQKKSENTRTTVSTPQPLNGTRAILTLLP